MKSLLPIAAAAALFLGFSAPASAKSASLGTAGGWAISTEAGNCHGTMEYANDTALVFSITSDGRAGISVYNPRWNIPKGQYRAWVGVDRNGPGEFEVRADGDLVFMPWQLRSDQIELVARGAVLHVMVGAQSIDYRLEGSAAMLAAVGRCAGTLMNAANPFSNTRSLSSSSNPFAGN